MLLIPVMSSKKNDESSGRYIFPLLTLTFSTVSTASPIISFQSASNCPLFEIKYRFFELIRASTLSPTFHVASEAPVRISCISVISAVSVISGTSVISAASAISGTSVISATSAISGTSVISAASALSGTPVISAESAISGTSDTSGASVTMAAASSSVNTEACTGASVVEKQRIAAHAAVRALVNTFFTIVLLRNFI